MKSKFFILAIVFVCTHMQAQVNAGRVMLGADLTFRKNSQEDYNSPFTQYNFNKRSDYGARLRYGVLITDHIMIGIVGEYNNSKTITDYPQPNWQRNTSKSSAYGGGLFTRYYKSVPGSRFAFFGQLSTTYNRMRNEQVVEYDNPIVPRTSGYSNGNSLSVYLNPGLTYFVNKTVAIEIMFGGFSYSSMKFENYGGGVYYGDTSNSNFGFGLFNTLSLGLNFYFGNVKNSTPEAAR